MRKVLISGLALAAVLSVASPAQAFGWRKKCCPEPCCPPPPMCVTYVDKVVTCYKPEWRTQDVACVVNQMVPREVITKHTCTVMVPVMTVQKRVCTVNTLVPRVVEREVTCCRMVAVPVTDPCTGCVTMCCKPQTFVQKVSCTVHDCVPVQKEYTVNVCSYTPQVREYERRCVVYDCKPTTVVQKRSYCVMVPYQTVVKVAVCVPAPAPAPCAPVCCK